MLILHKISRFLLATFLWLHALFLWAPIMPSLSPLAIKLHMTNNEFVVVLLILLLSVLVTYGIGNVLLDAVYIYFFPFVVAFRVVQLTYKFLRGIDRLFATIAEDSGTSINVDEIPGWPKVRISRGASNPVESQEEPPAPDSTLLGRLRKFLVTPFFRFSLLWCVLLLLSSNRLLLTIALVVVLLHIGKALFAVVGLTIFSRDWFSGLENRIRSRSQELIERVLAADEGAPSQSLSQTVGGLAFIQLVLAFLRNRQRVSQWATFLGLLVFLGIYLYMAFLFSVAYCGISRLNRLDLTWSNSIVDSVFIPFAYSDLPKNVWLKALAGFHAFFVIALGVSTFFGYLKKRLDSLYKVADSLDSQLQRPEVQTKIIVIADKIKPETFGRTVPRQ